MARFNHVYGDEDIRRFYREFPRKVTDRVIKQAAKEPAWLLSREAGRDLQNSPAFRNFATDAGYSKLIHVAGAITPKSLKRALAVQPSWTANDVYVKGSRRERWSVWGWANLLMKGRGGGKEKARGRSRSTNTGTTKGAGDYVESATNRVGSHALAQMTINLKVKMAATANRMIRKQIKLHG